LFPRALQRKVLKITRGKGLILVRPHVPGDPNSKLLVLVDTFMGWVEAELKRLKNRVVIAKIIPNLALLKVSRVVTVPPLNPE
jgi:hypothetical protein